MELKKIKTESEYKNYLEEFHKLMMADPEDCTPEFDRLELLELIIRDYEESNFHIPYPDPIEAIKFCMEQQGLQQKDLVECIGRPSRVSEILNRKRQLTLPMIRKLSEKLGIPASILIQETHSEPSHQRACYA